MQREWMSKGVRNANKRSARRKEKDKFIRAHQVATAEKEAAKAHQTERMIERLEVVEEPRKEWSLQFSIAQAPGRVTSSRWRGVRWCVGRGRRGRSPWARWTCSSTLVTGWRSLGRTGRARPPCWTCSWGRLRRTMGTVSLGSRVVVGEVDQARRLLDAVDETPLARVFAMELPEWTDADRRTLLAKFGLAGGHVGRSAATLSPGERTRAALALLQARGVNLLVLDEPTNHLDLPAIEQLEQALEAFDGTLLLVTHDRRMLEMAADAPVGGRRRDGDRGAARGGSLRGAHR